MLNDYTKWSNRLVYSQIQRNINISADGSANFRSNKQLELFIQAYLTHFIAYLCEGVQLTYAVINFISFLINFISG